MSRHHAATLAATVLTALAVVAPAEATTLLGASVKVAAAHPRSCEARLMPPARGVALLHVRSRDTGLVRVRLAARGGDWDVAVFDERTRRLVAAGAGFRAPELAEGLVMDGQRLVVQACRRSGSAPRAHLWVETIALPPPTGEKIRLVRVKGSSHAERTRLASSDFDLTEHGRGDFLDVLAHGDGDLRRLRAEKFDFEVVLDDVVAADRAAGRRWSPGDGTPVEGARAPIMPSGRVGYRHLWDYSSDMKALIEDPDLKGYVRRIILAHPSLEGRDIEGIEIAKDVHREDGRPVFLQMGLHHAREWSSGEHALEFGIDLLENRDVASLRFGDRAVNVKALLERVRTIVIPVVNPDGFNVSREAAEDVHDVIAPASLAYKRKNCRISDGELPREGQCAASPANRGVDLNRNYGGFWGGLGASGSHTSETYWGAGPFSEPEVQAVRELVSGRQVVALITNHTYSDLVLRPPGLKSLGAPFDEVAHYKPLGDAMAAENGYVSQHSYQLYDTTGTTEDWSYYATGGLGFTFEIGNPLVHGSGFQPPYPAGVLAEYFGKGPSAGRGNRAAYFRALEFAAQPSGHSIIEGRARPGSTLRLEKSFDTLTSPQPEYGRLPIALPETLSSTLRVGEGGEFVWHVNPSTRPAIAKGASSRTVAGPPSAPREFATQSPPHVPGAGLGELPGSFEDVPFDIPAGEDNGRTTVRIEYPPSPLSNDLDVRVYRRTSGGDWDEVAAALSLNGSTQPCTIAGRTGQCHFEQAVVPDLGNGQFKFRVENYESMSTDWRGRMTFEAPVADPGSPPSTERWTLTCFDNRGRVDAERTLVVARGERVHVGDACKKSKKA